MRRADKLKRFKRYQELQAYFIRSHKLREAAAHFGLSAQVASAYLKFPKRVRAYVAEGHSHEEAAAHFGVRLSHIRQIYYVLRKTNLSIDLVREQLQTMTIKEIAVYHNVSQAVIYRAVRTTEVCDRASVQTYLETHTLEEAVIHFGRSKTHLQYMARDSGPPSSRRSQVERRALREKVKIFVAAGNSIPAAAIQFQLDPPQVSYITGYDVNNIKTVADEEIYNFVRRQDRTVREAARHFGVNVAKINRILNLVQQRLLTSQE